MSKDTTCRKDISVQKKKMKEEKPEVYAVKRRSRGWNLSRRSFLASAAASGIALTGKGFGKNAHPVIRPSDSKKIDCKLVTAHVRLISSIAVNPEDTILATGSYDETVKLWAFPAGSILKSLKKHTALVTSLAVSPNGKWLLSGSYDKNVCVWSLKRKKLRRTFSWHSHWVKSIVVTPDSKKAISIDADGKIAIWSLPGCQLLKSWEAADSNIVTLAISPDGKILASGDYEWIRLWSLEPGSVGKLLKTFQKIDRKHAWVLDFSPDGKWLAAGYDDSVMRIWSIPDGKLHKSVNQPGYVRGLAFSPNGKFIAAGSNCIKIHSFPDCKQRKTLDSDAKSIWSLAYSHDGKYLAAGYSDDEKFLRIWKMPKGKFIRCFIDLDACFPDKYGVTYKYKDTRGRWVEVTVPDCACAPRIPKYAVCVCNTVPGNLSCSCVGHTCICVGHTCSCVGFGHYWYPN